MSTIPWKYTEEWCISTEIKFLQHTCMPFLHLFCITMPSNFSFDQFIVEWHVTPMNFKRRFMDKDQLIILFFVMKLCERVDVCMRFSSCYICILLLLFRPCCMRGISINSWKESLGFSINRTSQNMVHSYTSQFGILKNE